MFYNTIARALSGVSYAHIYACARYCAVVTLAQVQSKPFYHPFYPDITHMRKDTRPSPAFPYCKRHKTGPGLGTRLEFIYCKPQGVLTSTNQGRYTASYKFQLGQLEGSEAMCSTSYVHYRIARLDIHSAVTQLDASAGPRLPIE